MKIDSGWLKFLALDWQKYLAVSLACWLLIFFASFRLPTTFKNASDWVSLALYVFALLSSLLVAIDVGVRIVEAIKSWNKRRAQISALRDKLGSLQDVEKQLLLRLAEHDLQEFFIDDHFRISELGKRRLAHRVPVQHGTKTAIESLLKRKIVQSEGRVDNMAHFTVPSSLWRHVKKACKDWKKEK